MKASEEWIRLGYKPDSDPMCYSPGGGEARIHVSEGRCAWSASTCDGPERTCERCGIPYCGYHFAKHRRPVDGFHWTASSGAKHPEHECAVLSMQHKYHCCHCGERTLVARPSRSVHD